VQRVEVSVQRGEMSVFRNAKRIAKGVLPEELDDSEDSDGALDSGAESGEDDGAGSDGESHSVRSGEDQGSDGEEGDSDADSGPLGSKRQKTGADAAQAGFRWVRPGRAGEEASSDGESEDDAAEDAEVDPSAISFPARCALCTKTFFNMEQLQLHMVSKGHAKKQRVYDQGQKKFFRSAAQVAKLKARNERKKQNKLAKKREQREKPGHVWGEHKKPPKSPAQRAAEAAAAAPKKPKDTRTRAEKRASAKQQNEPKSVKKDHVGGGGRHRPGDRGDWDSLPKQQGKRKNRQNERRAA
jgi:flagellar biosynthesis GTPase FlhF